MSYIAEDIVVFQGAISRYDIFLILGAEDKEIRHATKEEINRYYQNWNK